MSNQGSIVISFIKVKEVASILRLTLISERTTDKTNCHVNVPDEHNNEVKPCLI